MNFYLSEINLKIIYDSSNNKSGLLPEKTLNKEFGFDPVWNGEYIFHDVFEHSHEGNKYFNGKNFLNIGGEMAASGSLYFFLEDLKINRFPFTGSKTTGYRAMKQNSFDLIEEICSTGDRSNFPKSISSKYGFNLRSNIPKQNFIASSLSNIEEDLKNIILIAKKTYPVIIDTNKREFARNFKSSLKKNKIMNLHRWGWWNSSTFIVKNLHNMKTLNHFIVFWENFCKNNSPKELHRRFESIKIAFFIDNEKISWNAFLVNSHHEELVVY